MEGVLLTLNPYWRRLHAGIFHVQPGSPCNKAARDALLFQSLFYRWGKWGPRHEVSLAQAPQWKGRVGFKPRLIWSLSWSVFCCMSSAPEAWFPGWSRSWSPGSLVLWGDLWSDPGIIALCPSVCWRADVCLRPHCPNPQWTCRADSSPLVYPLLDLFFFWSFSLNFSPISFISHMNCKVSVAESM